MKKSRGVAREGMNRKAFSSQIGHALQGSFQPLFAGPYSSNWVDFFRAVQQVFGIKIEGIYY